MFVDGYSELISIWSHSTWLYTLKYLYLKILLTFKTTRKTQYLHIFFFRPYGLLLKTFSQITCLFGIR